MTNYLNAMPQSPSSAINFIDQANEQQLMAMVAAKNGYSPLALSKLQAIRDAKMKAQAAQPAPAPLSESIPQQLEQMSRLAQPMQGIAALNAPKPEEYARGGVVAFSNNLNQPVGPDMPTSELDMFMDSLRNPLQGIDERLSKPAQNQPLIPSVQPVIPSVVDTFVKSPAFQAANQPAKPPALTPGAPGEAGIRGLLPSLKDVEKATAAQNTYISELERINQPTFNQQEYERAVGNKAEDTKKIFANLQEMFPDSTQEFREQIRSMKEETATQKSQAPYQGLLKMSLALMSNTGRNFMDALGKAGAVGTEEYNNILKTAKESELKLLDADAKMAAAQDARRRGLFDVASRQSEESKQDRLKAYDLEKDSKSKQVALSMQIAAAKAGLPAKEIELRTSLAQAFATIRQAYKETQPEAIKLWNYAQKNPEFAQYIKTQEDLKRNGNAYIAFVKQYDDIKKAAIVNGTDASLPSEDDWVAQKMRGFTRLGQPQNFERGSFPMTNPTNPSQSVIVNNNSWLNRQ